MLQPPSMFTQARQPLINDYQQAHYFKSKFNFVVSLVLYNVNFLVVYFSCEFFSATIGSVHSAE